MSKHRQKKSIRIEATDFNGVVMKCRMDNPVRFRLRGDKLNCLIKSWDEKDEGTQQQ